MKHMRCCILVLDFEIIVFIIQELEIVKIIETRLQKLEFAGK